MDGVIFAVTEEAAALFGRQPSNIIERTRLQFPSVLI
jgi:hypothetical protein